MKKINRKILVTTGLLFLIVPLIFLFIIYNQRREAKAQEEQVVLVCDGDEIPIGEAIDETLAVGHTIINESQKMIVSSSAEIDEANKLLALADQCKAENCDTGCDSGTTTVDSPCMVAGPFGGPLVACAPWNCSPNSDGCYPCNVACWGLICCGANHINPWTDNNNCGVCGNVCPAGSTCGFVDSANPAAGAACWGTCSTAVHTCDVKPCSGSACPTGEISNALTQIENAYSQIVASKNAIYAEIDKRPGIIAKLVVVRAELPKCVTPAGELTEAQAKEAQTLYTCKEALYERALPSAKTKCNNLKNFICCYYK